MPVIRCAVALVWIYQGLWCKLLGRMPRHRAIVGSVPFLSPLTARLLLPALGAAECLLGVWALSGWRGREAAIVQTLLLAGMNAGGLLWAGGAIPDPGGMLTQNLAFLVLAWIAAGELHV